MPSVPDKPTKQVAALPIRFDANGEARVLLVTLRETQRFIMPKGWPMRWCRDHHTAAIKAQEEAGIIGRVHKKPAGAYVSWKRRADSFAYRRVKVFALEFRHQPADWKGKKGQRKGAWLTIDDAWDLVDEPGLVTILRSLPCHHSGRANKDKRVTRSGLRT